MCKPMAFRAYALIVGLRKDRKVLTRLIMTISELYRDLEEEKGSAVAGADRGRMVEGESSRGKMLAVSGRTTDSSRTTDTSGVGAPCSQVSREGLWQYRVS